MKVNKKYLLESILQVLLLTLIFVPGFCRLDVTVYEIVGQTRNVFSSFSSDLSFFDLCNYYLIGESIFSLLMLFWGVLVFGLYFSLINKKKYRYSLAVITPILTTIETLFLIITAFKASDYYYIHEGKSYSRCESITTSDSSIIFWCIFLLAVINVVTVLNYIKSRQQHLIDKQQKEEKLEREKNQREIDENDACLDEAYCGLGKHIVLCLFTFGIWYLIWTYRTTKFLNKTPGAEQYNPTNKLLLCIFVPFYQIYWMYKHGQRIDTFSKYKKLNNSDMATMCLILGIFIPIVACILMQDRINALCMAKTPTEEASTETEKQNAPIQVVSATSAADELKKYKDLLDSGVITGEEFDAKKKQLLGL